jgi:hypothetical protein
VSTRFNASQWLIVDLASRVLCFLILICISTPVAAQDVVGRRLFSDQLIISEPFVEDELSLPSILHIRRPATDGEAGALVTQFGAELKKRLTSNLEASVSGGLTLVDGDGGSSRAGFDNLQLGLKYQFLRDPERFGPCRVVRCEYSDERSHPDAQRERSHDRDTSGPS